MPGRDPPGHGQAVSRAPHRRVTAVLTFLRDAVPARLSPGGKSWQAPRIVNKQLGIDYRKHCLRTGLFSCPNVLSSR